MQRVSVWAIGLVITVGLFTAEQGYAQEPICNAATLKGRYLFSGIATTLPPAVTEQSQLAFAGYHIFNGDGTGTDVVTTTQNGVISEENTVIPITYTVNADCTGTYSLPEGLSFGIFVAPTGEELSVIGTTPGFVLVQGQNRRVSPE
jgi:hypothetical protein